MKLLIFTYAPAGLGHLRVTDALVDSRPKDYPYIMLGSHDKFITTVHRFFSTNLVAKWIFTSFQYGLMEDLATVVYRWALVISSGEIYTKLKEILDEKKDVDEVWIVATHFGMAHQIGAVKKRLIRDTGKKIRLVVQVTDDTTQHIWCVRGADLTFVPSLRTKEKFEAYAKWKRMDLSFEVAPYPISPTLTKELHSAESRSKVFASTDDPINVSVPISGAAVGLPFIVKLISLVTRKTKRFKFWVLAKKSVYTDVFLSALSKLSSVNLITGRNDNEMINLYELMYRDNLVHMEITKPSEQAFKAILSPDLVGGSILLFTSPVGRQEFENVDFLVRQKLMSMSEYNCEAKKELLDSSPRAVRLPDDPKAASDFILWGLESGLFAKLGSSDYKFSKEALLSGEIGPSGANEFWKKVRKHFD